MRYPAEQTAARHERILREAAKLFRERGLNGVSVPEIMKAARLTHGPFYNHFASKDALVAESIDRAMGATLEDLLEVKDTKAGRRRYLDAYLSPQHRDNPGDGCVMASLAGDVIRSPAAKAPFTRRLKEILSATTAKFTAAREGRDARQEAIKLVSLIVGALVLSRAVDDEALSEEILAQARADL
ncbi:MAG: TetR/AcrR family transcriptional regulator [Gammaproteobacteria bacterium]